MSLTFGDLDYNDLRWLITDRASICIELSRSWGVLTNKPTRLLVNVAGLWHMIRRLACRFKCMDLSKRALLFHLRRSPLETFQLQIHHPATQSCYSEATSAPMQK
jgi:hypothetical protein